MHHMRVFTTSCAIACAVALTAVRAQADEVGFDNLSNNSGNAPTLAAQFNVDTSAGGDGIIITLSNDGPSASIITDVYIDDNAGVLDFSSYTLPTDWGTPASPPTLPTAPVGFVSDFTADSDPPPVSNGIDILESAGFSFGLAVGKTAQNVHDALHAGTLSIGIHVQAIGNESDTFITNPPPDNHVPEPASLLLALLGVAGIHYRRRR